MRCPNCKNDYTKVLGTVYNPKEKEEYRKRRCPKCWCHFFTVEFKVIMDKRFKKDWDQYSRE